MELLNSTQLCHVEFIIDDNNTDGSQGYVRDNDIV